MKAKIFTSLFGLPFFAVGVFMLWSIGSIFYNSVRMQSWTPVQATVTDGGYRTNGGDSDTWKAWAEYHYDWFGVPRYGNRVSISSMADNIGNYQQETGQRLAEAARQGTPVTVYVNPDAPDESIVDPGVRWGMIGFRLIFVVVFGGVGGGLIFFAWRAPKKHDENEAQLAAEPWRLNDKWQAASVGSNSRAAMIGAWIFAVLWSAISAPLPFAVVNEVSDKQNYAALLGLLFPIVGVGLLAWAIRRTLEWRRFGPTPVELDPFPGAIGGNVGGTIELRLSFDAQQEFTVTLTNVRRYVSGSGKNRSRKEKAVWQDSLSAAAAPGANGTRLEFRFDVPDGLEPSDPEPGDESHAWKLHVHADLAGVDFDREYEIPVFPTGAESRYVSARVAERSRSIGDAKADTSVARLLRNSGPHTSLFYPAGRMAASGLVGALVGGVFAVAGWFMIVSAGHTIFGGIFAVIGSLIFVASLYSLLNSLEVRLDGSDIVTIRRVLGVRAGTSRMPRSSIVELRRKTSMKSQSGGRHTIHYRIEAVDLDGNELVVGDSFRGRREADAAIRLLARTFGIRADSNDRQETSGPGVLGLDLD